MPRKPKEIIVEASILKRFAAFLVDLVIINLIVNVSFSSLLQNVIRKDLSGIEQLRASFSNPLLIKIGIIISLISLIYFAAMEYRLGQTLGKMIFNLHIQNDNSEKKIWQYFARSVYFIPMFPFDLFWVVDPIYMIFDKDRRRFSEMISKTRTVGRMVVQYETIQTRKI